MQSSWRRLLIVCISALTILLRCRTAEPEFMVTFDMLSPQEQTRVRPLLNTTGNVDPAWQAIVRKACQRNPYANCACCQEKTKRDCNPNNWDCCSSVVFAPADGSSCAYPSPCGCTPPPT